MQMISKLCRTFCVQRNLYKILELSKNASQEEIKKSFQALAKKHHPDIDPKNQETFKHIL